MPSNTFRVEEIIRNSQGDIIRREVGYDRTDGMGFDKVDVNYLTPLGHPLHTTIHPDGTIHPSPLLPPLPNFPKR